MSVTIARSFAWIACYLMLWSVSAHGQGNQLELEKITANVYAIVGPLGNRTPENLGNNATFGLIVTADGAVLVDPGGSYLGAAAIESVVRRVTDLPVTLVINTGGQDHRWLGNGYFGERGARVIASARAVADHRDRTQDQLIALDNLVGEEGMAGTEPVYAGEVFEGRLSLDMGGTAIEILEVGPAHTPGDSLVWLPRERVLFTGDVVYTGRMLGVIAVSSSSHWLEAFETAMSLQAEHIVPGHGPVTDADQARADTRDYLTFLRASVRSFMQDGGDIKDIGAVDQSRFGHLYNYTELKGRNAQRVYEELEWE